MAPVAFVSFDNKSANAAKDLSIDYFDLSIDYLSGKSVNGNVHPVMLLAFHNELSVKVDPSSHHCRFVADRKDVEQASIGAVLAKKMQTASPLPSRNLGSVCLRPTV